MLIKLLVDKNVYAKEFSPNTLKVDDTIALSEGVPVEVYTGGNTSYKGLILSHKDTGKLIILVQEVVIAPKIKKPRRANSVGSRGSFVVS